MYGFWWWQLRRVVSLVAAGDHFCLALDTNTSERSLWEWSYSTILASVCGFFLLLQLYVVSCFPWGLIISLWHLDWFICECRVRICICPISLSLCIQTTFWQKACVIGNTTLVKGIFVVTLNWTKSHVSHPQCNSFLILTLKLVWCHPRNTRVHVAPFQSSAGLLDKLGAW